MLTMAGVERRRGGRRGGRGREGPRMLDARR
jgi:hypothetical protein